MTKKVKVKSILNLDKTFRSNHMDYTQVICTTELSMGIIDGDNKMTIYMVNSYIELRNDILMQFKKTGVCEEICSERECDLEGASHEELQAYTSSFHKHYVEQIQDKADYYELVLDAGKSFVNRIKRSRSRRFSF